MSPFAWAGDLITHRIISGLIYIGSVLSAHLAESTALSTRTRSRRCRTHRQALPDAGCRMPDVRSSAVFEEFQPAFRELTAAYGRLSAGVVSGPVADTVGVNQLGGQLVEAVEVVIRMRSRGDEVTCAHAWAIAATCLRICGASEERIARAAGAIRGWDRGGGSCG